MPVATDSSLFQQAYQQLDGVLEPLRTIAANIIADSGGAVGFRSGFRDNAHQQRLWQEALAKYGDPEIADNWVARPGTSHHERGMAVDFTGDMDLLAKLAPKYGLMQPMDWEPWHWELGDGADYEGQGNLDFNLLDTPQANPEDVIANRMNAIFSMLGGNNDGYMSPMNQDELWGIADEQANAFDAEFMGNSGIAAESLQSAGELIGQFVTGSKGEYQKYAMKKLMAAGLDKNEIKPLIELWNRESGWNPEADNPTSSAAGIAQKMTSIHGALESTWQGQIDWGLNYILSRYGSPSKALMFHNRHNWY